MASPHFPAVVLALLAVFCTGSWGTEATKPPNILFAIADDWGPHAGAYGTKWVRTPNFDRVAREGLLFRRAYTPNAKCAPSRACILTGRNSWQLKEAANHICYFPTEFKSWGEALSEHDWCVGHTTKGWGPGSALDAQGKQRLLTGKAFNGAMAPAPTTGISTADYAANFATFLKAAPKDRPWCFWYGAVEPHRGYEFGSGIKKGGRTTGEIDRVPACWPDNETVRTDMLDYAFEVEHFDAHLGKMLAQLEALGELQNTIIVVTADHGMPFPRMKGQAYEMSNHVPLAIMWPAGIAHPGRVIDDYVSFIDIAPTVIDLAGLSWKETGMAPATGQSLRPILESDKSGRVVAARDHVLIGKERTDIGRPHDGGYPIRGIIKDDWLYLKNFEPSRWPSGNPETGYLDTDGGATKSLILADHRANPADKFWQLCFGLRPAEELYHIADDPACVHNLIGAESAAAVHALLAEQMSAQLKSEGDPRMFGKGAVFDKYPHANKGHAGFYEKFMSGEKLQTGWIEPTDIDPLSRP